MLTLQKRFKKYKRRFHMLMGAKKIGASVMEHKQEYAILAKQSGKYLAQNLRALKKGKQ